MADRYKIPANVKREAKLSLVMMKNGFMGGTKTGWDRAKQLSRCTYLPHKDALVMRAWFARHGPRAKNGGTSYPGYKQWIHDGKPLDLKNNETYGMYRKRRGAISYLLWGGESARKWIEKLSL